MKRFYLDRHEDETGISGTGKVAEGVQFSNGKVVLAWLGEHPSVVVWDSIQSVEKINGHNGKTKIVWVE